MVEQLGRRPWKQHRAEPLCDHRSADQPGGQALQMEQSVYNKSSYSQGSHSLEERCFCYCVTEREFGVVDTWCVRKEHNVGPRERCSVGMKNIVPLLTSVTFAYAQNVVSVAFLTMYFRLSFSASSHTHIAHQSFCNIC